MILEVNRQKVANVSQVTRELQNVQPGQPVFLLVWRDGSSVFVTMTKHLVTEGGRMQDRLTI